MDIEHKIYLTKEGLDKLREEYESLKGVRVEKAKEEVSSVASSQDVGSEFSTFQDDLRQLELRIEEIETTIKNHTLIISPPRGQRRVVFMGATVLVEVEGQTDEFTIVGSLEADPMLGKISNESPVGKSLLGHKMGDSVKVQSSVVTIYTIKKIIYNF